MNFLHKHFSLLADKPLYNIAIAILSLLTICAVGPISINLGLIDFSFQTLCIMLMALFLKPLPSFILIAFYLVLGALGMPVFSGYSSGYQHFESASAGFLFSFPFFAMFFSNMVSRYRNKPIGILICSTLAQLGLILLGFAWIIIGYEMEVHQLWQNIYLLLPGLILKAVLITIINYLFLNYIFSTDFIH